ncbi:hypothetical protein [Micromonospora sediminimaris]|uniref:Uncharacterized protein n=1 Tax=Micromonospora sediminimaris TaxID=547162 RepID=A0A9W5UR30_9ACTN|nr:hypothetical protein [Micromonospora sediminimaris]GIJ32801.1 hypothetical protein Vse01_19490 [Micromonospora sediminimaris]SFD06452.1 hypothetical protein SAMN05216284_110172 [Micromonospora sediminimaris]
MTARLLSLAQILNRLALTARRTLREHCPSPGGPCPICRLADCATAAAARDVLDAITQLRWHRLKVPPHLVSSEDPSVLRADRHLEH